METPGDYFLQVSFYCEFTGLVDQRCTMSSLDKLCPAKAIVKVNRISLAATWHALIPSMSQQHCCEIIEMSNVLKVLG